ncbi:hypothetical protein [Halobacillus litoralis]|uniref:hypothetical protein n=1 Tax=Halobacillus litoralis TaxID=45668 RepID=UPI000FFC4372|nr:hypothetical protein [Halobacillus litoralis]
MKKFLLVLSLIINTCYIGIVLIDFDIRFSAAWNIMFGVFFALSILLASVFLFQSRRRLGSHPYLSVSVLSLSLASLGWFLFINYLSFIMG